MLFVNLIVPIPDMRQLVGLNAFARIPNLYVSPLLHTFECNVDMLVSIIQGIIQ